MALRQPRRLVVFVLLVTALCIGGYILFIFSTEVVWYAMNMWIIYINFLAYTVICNKSAHFELDLIFGEKKEKEQFLFGLNRIPSRNVLICSTVLYSTVHNSVRL